MSGQTEDKDRLIEELKNKLNRTKNVAASETLARQFYVKKTMHLQDSLKEAHKEIERLHQYVIAGYKELLTDAERQIKQLSGAPKRQDDGELV